MLEGVVVSVDLSLRVWVMAEERVVDWLGGRGRLEGGKGDHCVCAGTERGARCDGSAARDVKRDGCWRRWWQCPVKCSSRQLAANMPVVAAQRRRS